MKKLKDFNDCKINFKNTSFFGGESYSKCWESTYEGCGDTYYQYTWDDGTSDSITIEDDCPPT